MSSWNCPKCNFNNAEGWIECNSCWNPKPICKVTQEDRIETLNILKSHLEEIKLINPDSKYVSWIENIINENSL
jgi:hypothetical protein